MKKCFKCGITKELSDFYKHNKMKDGLLGKCKDCTKSDVSTRELGLRKDPNWIASERKRGRDKYHRLNYIEKKTPYEQKAIIMDRYENKYPEKKSAKYATGKIKKKEGMHLHHWSYNKEHYKDVIELPIQEHFKLHRYLIYDQERKMYRRCDNNLLLDTKESHINYFNEILYKE
jgi:hypothetical protein